MREHIDLYAPTYYQKSDIPENLYSEIVPGLWMGGTADDDWIEVGKELTDSHDIDFQAVVTLFSWAHPMPWGIEELRWGFPDGHIDLVDKLKLFRIVDWAYERWQAGDKTLIRCQAGLNRSGLITAMVLMKADYSVKDAIELIRSNRAPIALFNNHFVDYLVSLSPSER
ncbi:MAG: protein-tyrosine phosphatase family protein [Candidatus Nanopelagicales bacterium]